MAVWSPLGVARVVGGGWCGGVWGELGVGMFPGAVVRGVFWGGSGFYVGERSGVGSLDSFRSESREAIRVYNAYK